MLQGLVCVLAGLAWILPPLSNSCSISPTSFPPLPYILRVLGIECCPGTQTLHFRGLLGNPKPPKPETPNPELLNPERLNAKTLNPQILSPKTLNRRPWDGLTPEP